MSTCLDERDLVMLAVGERDAEAEAHAAVCGRCGERRRRASADLERIRRALEGPPVPGMAASPRRWRPVAVVLAPALAAALALIVGLGALQRDDGAVKTVSHGPPAQPAVTSYAEVSAAVFDAASEPSLPASSFVRSGETVRGVGAADLEVALGAGSPCTARGVLGASCNDYTSALFF